jgi:hypothetical protein
MTSRQLFIGASLLATLHLASNAADAAELTGNVPPRAVQATNFSLGLVASDSDTKDSTSNGTFGLTGVANMPIGDWFGASVTGNIARTTARTSDVLFDVASQQSSRPSCRFNNSDASVSVFARRATLGRVSASYGTGKVTSDCGDQSAFVSTGDDNMGVDFYRVAAEAYLWDFTVGAVHTSTKLEDGPTLDSDIFSASWYPFDSLRVTLSGGDEYDEDTYGIEIEHQPEFMGNSLGVSLGYSVLDRKQETSTINFSVVYHFGTKVELKARDRQYR